MGNRKCKDLIEEIESHNPDCPAVRQCRIFNRLCDFPNRIEINDDECDACKDFTLNEHCTCRDREKR